MTEAKNEKLTDLRRRAETIAGGRDSELDKLSLEDMRRLAEELQVHQIELELQNEALEQTARELAAAQHTYRRLYDFAPVGYLTLDRKGVILEANLTAAEQLNLERSQLLGRSLARFVVPADQDDYYFWKEQLFAAGVKQQSEIRLVGAGDGAEFSAHLTGLIERDERDRLLDRCRTAVSDITQLRETQAKAWQSGSRWQTLVKNLPDHVMILDSDGLVQFTNRGLSRLPLQEMIGRPLADLLPPEQQAPFRAVLEQVRQTGRATAHELTLDAPSGQSYWSYRLGVIEQQGRLVEFVIIGTDVTAARRTEETLRQSEERFRRIFEEGPLGMGIFDAEARFTRVNARFCQLVGYSEAELTGLTIAAVTHPAYRPETTVAVDQLLRGERAVFRLEKQIMTRTGEAVWIAGTATAIRDEAGEFLYGLNMIEDIGERKKMEQEKGLLLTLIQTINQAQEFEAALQITLNRLCADTGWTAGEVWLPQDSQADETRLVISEIYYCREETEFLRRFFSGSRLFKYPPETGLPGQVWASGQPEWVRDAARLPAEDYPRLKQAREAGLTVALGAPLGVDQAQGGLLILYRDEPHPAEERAAALVAAVAVQLGALLQRQQARQKTHQLLRAIEQQREELRALAIRLAEAQEAERQQLAQELHDKIGQNLTALGFNLDFIQMQTAEVWPADHPAQSRLQTLLELVQQTTDRVRDVIVELRPPMLDEYGLVEALDWYATHFAARVGLAITISGATLTPRLEAAIENALFRITQEALTNIAEHAQAGRATVSITTEAQTLRLLITDDGVGFDVAAVSPPEKRAVNLGLLSMKERAEAIGGRFRLESRPGQGTRIQVELDR